MERSGISIEPRILEYLKYKKFNIKNNIVPSVSLEKRYNITSCDVATISQYFSGQPTRTDSSRYFIAPEKAKFENDVEKYKSQDVRLKKKLKLHEEARKSVSNLENVYGPKTDRENEESMDRKRSILNPRPQQRTYEKPLLTTGNSRDTLRRKISQRPGAGAFARDYNMRLGPSLPTSSSQNEYEIHER